MRKLTVILTVTAATAAILSTASLTWKAEAAPWLAASQLRAAAEISAPMQKVACWPGERNYCRYHWKPGRYGGCVPCRHGPGY
jgi:hypothetical protein